MVHSTRITIAAAVLTAALIAIPMFPRTGHGAPVAMDMPAPERPVIQVQSLFEFLFGSRRNRADRPRRERRRAPRPQSSAPSSSAPPQVEKAPDAKRVVVIGDGFASGLAKALEKRFSDTPGVVIVDRSKSGSGIVRYDYYDWNRELGRILETDNPAALVVMIGSNDRQDIVDDAGNKHEFRTQSWLNLYERRVQDLLDHASARNLPLYWVGLPIMRSRDYGQNIAFLNEIYAQQGNRINAVFVDTWERFADEEGKYNASGPDEIGRIRRLRLDNGIHMTRQGNNKLAYFVDLELRPRLIGLFASLDPGASGENATGDPRKRMLDVEISLTEPPINPGDVNLAGARNEVVSNQDSIISNSAALEPRPGRADDFSWPKPEASPENREIPPL